MKKIDYYAAHEPWKMPKWIGATLGVIFASVAVGAAALIVHLTRPAHADVPPPVAALAAPAVPAPAAVAAVETPPPVSPAVVADSSHHKNAKSAHGAKLAKHSARPSRPAITHDKASAILAKHDSHSKRKDKDDLDRMLGL